MALQIVPDDPSRYIGREFDGTQCICKCCSQKTVFDGRTICNNCGHIESAHPELPAPPVAAGSLIRQYQDAGRLASTPITSASSQLKATTEDTELETVRDTRTLSRHHTQSHDGQFKFWSKVATADLVRYGCGPVRSLRCSTSAGHAVLAVPIDPLG
ncbi:hypothetical protein B0H17DRAFT_1135546 [Mycena rosella]|uniref:Uncharacterized protein n=1 Tax=Mycena rosella TaxID=1033263 RepID=A0AAD7DCU7_MYCRO|nr:hypothetical protein B0H17DRAFT_1135546 [Mycena rosella]